MKCANHEILVVVVIWLLTSCINKKEDQSGKTSYWQSLKDSFAINNLSSFIIDANLDSTYKTFHRIRNRVIDSAIKFDGEAYLHSWQKDRSEFTAFTVFVDDGEHGRRIVYFIFDKSDSLRSATQVALKAGEGGVEYETRSRFIANDTLLGFHSATTEWDFTKRVTPPPRLRKPIGDSTFFQLVIQQDGSVSEKVINKKRELQLE